MLTYFVIGDNMLMN